MIDLAEVYRQEMARRGYSLPKRTPRPTDKRERTSPRRYVRDVRLDARNAEMASWYVTTPDMSLADVVAKSKHTHGDLAITNAATVSRIFRAMRIAVREQGQHFRYAMLQKQVAQLTADKKILLGTISGLRLRLRNLGEAA